MTPVITAHLLRNMLMCERRVWLDAHGDLSARDEIAPDTRRQFELGLRHERIIQLNTAGQAESIPVSTWDEGVAITRDLMAQGVAGILSACLEHCAPLDLTDTLYTMRGTVDQLRRVSHHGDDVYSPIEIKQRAQPVEADWVQLDLYVWLLGQIQGILPPAELWLGADAYGRPRRRLPHGYDEDRLMALALRALQTFTAAQEPPVRIEAHCNTCHWYSSCQAIAQREKRIDLLYGVSGKTRRNLEAAGITSLAQVAALSVAALQEIKGIGPKTAPRIRANAQAWLENRPVWLDSLPDAARQPGWMFDLETREARGKIVPWCMGWCDSEGQTRIVLVAPVQLPEALTLPDGQRVTLAPDSDSAWEVFAQDAAAAPVYHWTAYDATILRGSAPADTIRRLEPRLHDLHATLKQVVTLPLKSASIKPVSMHLGFAWPGYTDWFAAYLDYQHWLDTGDLDALTRACMYQRADVQSMALVWRWLVANAPG